MLVVTTVPPTIMKGPEDMLHAADKEFSEGVFAAMVKVHAGTGKLVELIDN